MIFRISQVPYSAQNKKIAEKYSEEEAEILKDIWENGNQYTKEKWEEIFRKCIENEESPVLQEMASYDNLPEDIRDSMINYLIKTSKTKFYNMEQRDYILCNLFSKPLSKKQADTIIWFYEKENDVFSNFIALSKDIPEENLKRIIENFLPQKSKTNRVEITGSLRAALLNIRDEEYVKLILKSPLCKENVRNLLIQNKNLSDEIKKEIWNEGVDIEHIGNAKNISKEIMEDIYNSVVYALTESEVNPRSVEDKSIPRGTDRNIITAYEKAKNIMIVLIQSNTLTEDMEYDLYERFKDMDLRRNNDVLSALIHFTKNEKILRDCVKNIKSEAIIRECMRNEHMPEDIVQREAEKIIKQYNKKQTLSRKNKDTLITICQKQIALPEQAYRIFFADNTESRIGQKIIMSPYTPIGILNQMDKMVSPYTVNDFVLANINLYIREKVGIISPSCMEGMENILGQMSIAVIGESKEIMDKFTGIEVYVVMYDEKGKPVSNIEELKNLFHLSIEKIEEMQKRENIGKEVKNYVKRCENYFHSLLNNYECFEKGEYKKCSLHLKERIYHLWCEDFCVKNRQARNFYRNIEEFIKQVKPLQDNIQKEKMPDYLRTETDERGEER